MWLFGKRDPIRKQNWSVIAFDDGFKSETGHGSQFHHHIEFRMCRITGERDIRINPNHSKTARDIGDRHSGIIKAKYSWIENSVLRLSDRAQLYSDDWKCMIKPTDKTPGRWDQPQDQLGSPVAPCR